jgi:hypothetical protein
MRFSVTGNLLTGTTLRPDFITFTRCQGDNFRYDTLDCSKLNIKGKKLKFGVIAGTCRASLGLIHTIVHFAIAVFEGLHGILANNQNFKDTAIHHFSETGLGLKNFGRGLIEMIPIFGALTLSSIDKKRVAKFISTAEAIAKKNPDKKTEYVAMFYCEKQVNISRPVEILLKSSNFKVSDVPFQTLENYIINEETGPRHIKDANTCTQLLNEFF